MFHLTRYKYIFFAISLAVIVPGVLALVLWGLNLGIDFTNGSTVNLQFANNVTTAQVQQVFAKQFKAQDVSVYASTDLNGTTKPNQVSYITLDRAIDKNEVDSIVAKLRDSKANLPKSTLVSYYLDVQNGTSHTSLVVVQFDKAVQASAVQNALHDLPQTGLPPAPTANATATASATGTASASATATPSTSTATQTFPVNVKAVELAKNMTTIQVNTQTPVNTSTHSGKVALDLNQVVYALNAKYGPSYVQSTSSVGPSVASETTRNAFFAVALASLFIMVYIGIAFRKVGSFGQALRFGASAIIALLHDALVVLGLWAIFGHFFDFKVDSLFLTAVLTVIGFSVHDTIVVFDRIRENLSRHHAANARQFETVVNASLVQTMSRSLNTSLTVLFTLAALTLFGGASVRDFTLALLIGIMSGTYSSIFNASMILVVWETKEYRKWFPWLRNKPQQGVRGRPAPRALASTRA